MSAIASQITSLTIVYSIVYSDADQRNHQSSASLAFVWGIHRDRWIPRTKGQLRGKCFHSMTSSCIFVTHLITIIIKLEVSPFSLMLYFSVVVYQMCKAGYLLPLLCDYMMARRAYSFVSTLHLLHYHYADLSENIYPNKWNTWQIYFVDCVHKTKYILSVTCIQYAGLFFLGYPILFRQAELWRRASIWRSHRKIVIKQCSYHNNIIDIKDRLPYSKVVYPAIIVLFSCLMEVNHGVRTGPNYPFR